MALECMLLEWHRQDANVVFGGKLDVQKILLRTFVVHDRRKRSW